MKVCTPKECGSEVWTFTSQDSESLDFESLDFSFGVIYYES